MKRFILFLLVAAINALEISNNCPENKTIGYFGDCPESCLSLIRPPEFCSLKSNYGCICREGYVLLQDQEFFSDCIKPEDCPANPDMPAAPLDLKVQEVWSRSARVSWSPSYTAKGLITKYILQYWRHTVSGGRRHLIEKVASSQQASTLIKNLHPATSYALIILAGNKVRQSDPSHTIYFTTNEEEPSSPPRDVNAEVNGTTSLLVSWEPPLKSEWNGELRGFYVGYKSVQNLGGFYTFRTADYMSGGLQEYLLTNLRPNTEYRIIVKAFNNAGNGPPSHDIIAKTLDGEVPDTPLDLRVQEVSAGQSVNVSWSPPLTGSTSITNYVLQYWRQRDRYYYTASLGRGHLVEKMLKSDQTSTLIEDFWWGTKYCLTIVAENTVGQGKPSDTICVTMTETGPSKSPMDINVQAKGISSLLVTWKPPPDMHWNGKLKGFYVLYKSMQGSHDWNSKTVEYVPGRVQEYMITNLRKDTEYSIAVQAFNNAGSGPISTDIVVKTLGKEVPAAPQDLKVQEVWSNSARVSWSPPYTGNGSITKYVLQHWEESKDIHRLKEKVLNNTQLSSLIKNLSPCTNYTVAIVAENTAGRGKPSSIVSFTTTEDVPSEPPMDVNAEGKGTTSLLVTWKGPSIDHCREKGFYVGYMKTNGDNEFYTFRTAVYVPGGVQEQLITNLQTNTKYSIIVKAFNNAGSGPPSQDIIVKTLYGEVPRPPYSLKVQEVWSHSVNVSWSPPYIGNTYITNYVLQYWYYRAYLERRLKEKVVSSDQTSALITDLHPGTGYDLVIVAENTIGRGEPRAAVSFTTSEEKPSSPPMDVQAIDIKTTSLYVTWKSPPVNKRNGELKGFYVGYKNLQDSGVSYSFETINYSFIESLMITNLRPNTEYSIIVKAFNNAGSGPPSPDIISKTLDGATPRDVKVQEVWSRRARVTWSPPSTGNSSITKYILRYGKTEDEESIDVWTRNRVEKKEMSTTETSALIKGLSPATNYSLVIVSKKAMKLGEPSGPIFFTTLEEEPSSPPRDVKAEATGETSVLVTWRAPFKKSWNGKLEGYYVGYQNTEDSNSPYHFKTIFSMPEHLRKYNITDLHKDTEYGIIVKAFNNVGSGPPSSEIRVRTLGPD